MARLCAGLFVVLASGPLFAAARDMPAIESVVATAPMPMASVRRACELLGARLQSVSVEGCLKAGLKAGSIPSVNGQPLLYRDFLPQSAHAPPHRVLMLGGIHGDELSAAGTLVRNT